MIKKCECCKQKINIKAKNLKYCKPCASHNINSVALLKYNHEAEIKELKAKFEYIRWIREYNKKNE